MVSTVESSSGVGRGSGSINAIVAFACPGIHHIAVSLGDRICATI